MLPGRINDFQPALLFFSNSNVSHISLNSAATSASWESPLACRRVMTSKAYTGSNSIPWQNQRSTYLGGRTLINKPSWALVGEQKSEQANSARESFSLRTSQQQRCPLRQDTHKYRTSPSPVRLGLVQPERDANGNESRHGKTEHHRANEKCSVPGRRQLHHPHGTCRSVDGLGHADKETSDDELDL